ncbi:MAG: aminoacyl-tRNA hydrolase [Candidatus Hydrogenedentota bacterium]|nr:MAG: aminoacyl-tRNA hydrolase [Candidatus Hydrogenedentota bacterium]
MTDALEQDPRVVLVAGLGNPGSAYRGTFHNVGRETVQEFIRKAGGTFDEQKDALVAERNGVFFLLPQRFMNRSGPVLARFAALEGIAPEEILVVVDDLYLPTGRIRVRKRGGTAGHNGLKSIEEALGSRDYPRLRIGIGPDPGGDRRTDYVLSRPRPEVQVDLLSGIAKAQAAIDTILRYGVTRAMEVFNAG